MRISWIHYLGFVALSFTCYSWAYAQDYQVDQSYTVASAAQKYAKHYPSLSIADLDTDDIDIRLSRVYKKLGKRELSLDLFTPKNKKAAVTFALIHGGGWRSGNKSHMYALASRLAKRGYAVATIEYRLSPEALFPAGLVDINDAIVWLKQHAHELNIAARIIIGGGSSGGHMAALIGNSASSKAFRSTVNQHADNTVIAVIDMDGIIDLTSDIGLKFEDKGGKKDSAMARWIGGSFAEKMSRWQLASPAHYINAVSPPLLFIASGQPRFAVGAQEAVKIIEDNGKLAKLIILGDAPHTFWLFHPWLEQVVDAIDQFTQLLKT